MPSFRRIHKRSRAKPSHLSNYTCYSSSDEEADNNLRTRSQRRSPAKSSVPSPPKSPIIASKKNATPIANKKNAATPSKYYDSDEEQQQYHSEGEEHIPPSPAVQTAARMHKIILLPTKAVVFSQGDRMPKRGTKFVEIVMPNEQALDSVGVTLRVDKWMYKDNERKSNRYNDVKLDQHTFIVPGAGADIPSLDLTSMYGDLENTVEALLKSDNLAINSNRWHNTRMIKLRTRR